MQFLSFAASLQQIGNKQETCPVLCPVLGRQWGPHQPEFLSAGSCKGPATDFGSLYLPEISYISWNSSISSGWINTHPKESRQVTKCCPPKPKVHLPVSSQKENCLKGHHWSHFLVISSTESQVPDRNLSLIRSVLPQEAARLHPLRFPRPDRRKPCTTWCGPRADPLGAEGWTRARLGTLPA